MAESKLGPGLTIHYQDINPDGKPAILLLHGLGANGDSWQLQIPTLANLGYRVIVPDLRGFGRSSYPGGSNNPGFMAQDMIKLIEQLSLDRVHLNGISLGGTVALQVTISRPDLVASLVITNSFSRLRPKKFSQWLFYATRLLLVHLIGIDTQAKIVANRLFPLPEQGELRKEFRHQISQSDPRSYRSTMRSFASFDISAWLRTVKIPVLVVTGEKDTIVPPDVQSELANGIPTAEHILIRDAGHAVIIDKPDRYNQIYLTFLRDSGTFLN
jgi:pimeloyl-ACP methyl ester carboxylesterase